MIQYKFNLTLIELLKNNIINVFYYDNDIFLKYL